MKTQDITQGIVREYLHYDPDTGVFTWIKKRNAHTVVGSEAGTPFNGYILIGLFGATCQAHRLAWLYMTGRHPKEREIDHRNTIKNDNRWSNLREASSSLNKENRRDAISRSTTGVLGVSPFREKFRARICVKGKNKTIGIFSDKRDAYEAYLKEKRELHEGNTL